MVKKNVMIFRASDQIIKEIEKLVKSGVYRNKTEIINEALRIHLGLRETTNPNIEINSKVKRK